MELHFSFVHGAVAGSRNETCVHYSSDLNSGNDLYAELLSCLKSLFHALRTVMISHSNHVISLILTQLHKLCRREYSVRKCRMHVKVYLLSDVDVNIHYPHHLSARIQLSMLILTHSKAVYHKKMTAFFLPRQYSHGTAKNTLPTCSFVIYLMCIGGLCMLSAGTANYIMCTQNGR